MYEENHTTEGEEDTSIASSNKSVEDEDDDDPGKLLNVWLGELDKMKDVSFLFFA